MKKFLFFTLFSLLLNAEVVTKTTTKTAQGQGTGATYEQALSRALTDALGRMNGVKLSQNLTQSTTSISDGKNANLEKFYSDEITKITNGRFDSYEVIDEQETERGYKVKVSIKSSKTTKSYKAPGLDPHGRRKIAVIPAYYSTMKFRVFGDVMGAVKLSSKLTQELVSDITQTRKFTVLDRETGGAYENEKALIQQDGAKDELLKLGQVLGTDYLYLINISEFELDKQTKTSPLTGKVSQKNHLNATIEYRIVVMATRQIKYSNTQNFNQDIAGKNDTEILSNALKFISNELTRDIINNIYPPKVADVSGDEVLLTEKLNMGEVFEVYSLGEKIFDSYTKEAVGYKESLSGKVEVVRVTPKTSYAKILSGSPKKGDILRPVSGGVSTPESNRPSDIEQKDGGGVVLPFD